MFAAKAPAFPDWYPMDDEILIQAHLKGDKHAFEVLVKKYQSAVARLCFSIMHHDSGVADVVQDVFLSAFRGLKHFRGDSSFKTWLYKITVHETFRHLKKDQRWKSLVDQNNLSFENTEVTVVVVDNDPSPERLVLDAQQRQLVQQAIDQLSENHRVVLYLHYHEDLSVQEIAEVLEIPLGSVKSRLHYSRIRLKELLSPFFAGDFPAELHSGEAHAL